MTNNKPRHEYEVADIAIDRLSDGSAALHILTRQDIDLTVLLTTDQILQFTAVRLTERCWL